MMNKMTNLSKLKYFVIDVDGTLTDSGIYIVDSQISTKRFTTRDKVGVLAAKFCGIKTLVITGRNTEINEIRLNEMGIDYIFQGVKNKREFLQVYMRDNNIDSSSLGYVGDDLNDYGAMELAGFVACPSDSCIEIKKTADYISPVMGGFGVLQDVFRYVLSEMGKWDEFLKYIKMNGY